MLGPIREPVCRLQFRAFPGFAIRSARRAKHRSELRSARLEERESTARLAFGRDSVNNPGETCFPWVAQWLSRYGT